MTVILISLAVAFVVSPTPQNYNGPQREPHDSRVKILIFKCTMSIRSHYPQRMKGQIQYQQALCKIQKSVSVTLTLVFKCLEQWQ